jgi:hypothetical protein
VYLKGFGVFGPAAGGHPDCSTSFSSGSIVEMGWKTRVEYLYACPIA